jgi:hypothetical protein
MTRRTTTARRGLIGIAGAAAIGLALLQPSTGSADGPVKSGSLNGGSASPPPTPAPKLATQAPIPVGTCDWFLINGHWVCLEIETLP